MPHSVAGGQHDHQHSMSTAAHNDSAGKGSQQDAANSMARMQTDKLRAQRAPVAPGHDRTQPGAGPSSAAESSRAKAESAEWSVDAELLRVLDAADREEPQLAELLESAFAVFGEAVLPWVPLGELSHALI